MKKLWALFALLSILLVAGCGAEESTGKSDSKEKETKKKIALVLPEKIGVNPFFQQMDEGAKKAAKEFGVEVKTIESTDHSAIEENLRVAVAENYDLIITSSFESEDALKKVATENPDRKFAIIDTKQLSYLVLQRDFLQKPIKSVWLPLWIFHY
jgi:basic membrane protein A and related proteins